MKTYYNNYKILNYDQKAERRRLPCINISSSRLLFYSHILQKSVRICTVIRKLPGKKSGPRKRSRVTCLWQVMKLYAELLLPDIKPE